VGTPTRKEVLTRISETNFKKIIENFFKPSKTQRNIEKI
jgi:hypothetical protein